MFRIGSCRWIAPLLALGPGLAAAPSQAAEGEFENRVRPLLEEHCVRCHGKERQRSGLRLDSGAAVLAGGARGPAVVPGDPDASPLIEAVRYVDEDFAMPPKGKLAEEDIRTLEAWVASGAAFPDAAGAVAVGAESGFDLAERAKHWAFQPLAAESRGGDIDARIAAGLERAGLEPAPAASREDLLRRLSFDLTGLPPRPEWLAANAERELDAIVDELLATPQFGERWARHWLDLMRYAEGRGHEFDGNIPNAYQYRDYVVRAFNSDVPYDRFVTEHLAGDLLDGPRVDPLSGANESILGTGWWFLGPEMHSPVDIRKDELERTANQVDVLSRGFLGLTVACARCHDHKFDAIGTADFYSLSGFALGGSARQVRFETMLANGEVAREMAELEASSPLELQGKAAETVRREAGQLAHAFLTRFPFDVPSWHPALRIRADAARTDVEDLLHPFVLLAETLPGLDPGLAEVQFRTVFDAARARLREAAAGELEPRMLAEFAGGATLPYQDGYGFGMRARAAGEATWNEAQGLTVAAEEGAVWDPTWDVLETASESERVPAELDFDWEASGRMLRTPTVVLEHGRVFHRVRGSGHVYAVVDAHRMVQGPLHSQTTHTFAVPGDGWGWVEQDLTAYVGHRVHFEYTPARRGEDPSRFAVARVVESAGRPADPAAVEALARIERLAAGEPTLEALAERYSELFAELGLAWGAEERPAGEAARLGAWLLESWGSPREGPPVFARARARLEARIQPVSRTALAMLEGSGVDEFVLSRGNPETPLDVVERRYLEVFDGPGPLEIEAGSGRLELARRMTDPEHPLLARVWVNRLWHHLIGRGLVASVDDFGVMGEEPSHPELLDHLARRLIDGGWSTKAAIREIVLSDTYARSSEPSERALELDPVNLWLSHAHRRRLEGEAIRDALLAVSGTLDPTLGGPPVPLHLTDELQGRGRPAVSGPLDGDGRRSLYLAVRRNFMTPFLAVFDFPPPATTMGRRGVSSLPAQALTLLNDPFVIGEARRWAERSLAEVPGGEPRLERMFREALGRAPDEVEREALLAFAHERSAEADEAVAWTELAHTLFNLDEFLHLD